MIADSLGTGISISPLLPFRLMMQEDFKRLDYMLQEVDET